MEFSATLKKKNRNNCKLIVSYHNNGMSLTAEDLGDLATKIQKAGADIIKIVSIANNITDCYPMLQFLTCSKVCFCVIYISFAHVRRLVNGKSFGLDI